MRRGPWFAAWLVAWPAAAADVPAAPPDPEFLEFLEFLAEFDEDDEAFVEYIESRRGENELRRAEAEAKKDEDDG